MKVKRAIILVLILIWMGTVFMFSNQESDESAGVSDGVAKLVIDIWPGTKNLNNEEKEEAIERIGLPIRKVAHYTIYGVGGLLIVCLMNTYQISDGKKILYSQIIGSGYAITDEIHQSFVSGRGASIKDVFIDSLGIATGIVFGLIVYKVIKAKMNVEKRKT